MRSLLVLAATAALVAAAEAGGQRSRVRSLLEVGASQRRLPRLREVHAERRQERSEELAKAAAGSVQDTASAARFATKTSSTSQTQNGGSLGYCRNCVYVVERLKQGYQYMLPSICVEIFSKTNSDQKEYTTCHEVVAALSVWGHNVRHWMKNGCYKSEPYGASELVKPCPSHVICSQITDLGKTPFCASPGTDFVDQRGSGSGGGGGGSSGGSSSGSGSGEDMVADFQKGPFSGAINLNEKMANLNYDGANTDASINVGAQNGFGGSVSHTLDNGMDVGAGIGADGQIHGTIGGIKISGQNQALAGSQNDVASSIGSWFGS